MWRAPPAMTASSSAMESAAPARPKTCSVRSAAQMETTAPCAAFPSSSPTASALVALSVPSREDQLGLWVPPPQIVAAATLPTTAMVQAISLPFPMALELLPFSTEMAATKSKCSHKEDASKLSTSASATNLKVCANFAHRDTSSPSLAIALSITESWPARLVFGSTGNKMLREGEPRLRLV